MLLGAIADDFTGASDLANTLTRAGMATTQFVGVPSGPAGGCEAAVVALKTRSIAPDEAVRQSLEALAWLRAQGAEQIFFKYCSTFDSTPQGNIGPVADALLAATGGGVAVVCPVFPGAGRTLYCGHLFVNGVPLHESGMQNHPLTPMTDPDIRRWLGLQSRSRVLSLPWSEVSRGRAAIAAALAGMGREGPALVVVDALTDADLIEIGAALDGAALVTGGSGIAMGLPENFRRSGRIASTPAAAVPIPGAACVLSGSCSRMSIAQVAAYTARHPSYEIDVATVMEAGLSAAEIADWACEHIGQSPIIYTTASPDAVAAAQGRFGREAVSRRLEELMGALARRLVDRGVSRLAIGGGETSGAVVEALGLESLRIGPEIAPGVPAVYGLAEGGSAEGRLLGMALKSGNFGDVDFYERALAMLGDGA